LEYLPALLYRDEDMGTARPASGKFADSWKGLDRRRGSLHSPRPVQVHCGDPMTAITDPAKGFTGRWRILSMDRWGKEYLDLIAEAHLTFRGAAGGNIAFGTLEGSLEVTYVAFEQSTRAVFSWKGEDGADDVSGSGWAVLETDDRLVGHFSIEDGVVWAFVCERG